MGARRTCGGLVWPLLILATLGVVPAASSAAPLTPGNMLVTTEFETSLLEYTRDGDLVQAIPVPYPAAERPRTEGPRDILAILRQAWRFLIGAGLLNRHMKPQEQNDE